MASRGEIAVARLREYSGHLQAVACADCFKLDGNILITCGKGFVKLENLEI